MAIAACIVLTVPLLMTSKPEPVPCAQIKVNPNTAPMGLLMQLPGMGPVRAQALIEYRQRRPGVAFRRLEDLLAVPGLGPGTLRQIADYLTFEDVQPGP
jgi:competence ComEA-like helix-hairpin-helix protein